MLLLKQTTKGLWPSLLVGSSLKFGPSSLATNHYVKPTDSAHSIDDPTCLSTPHCHIHLTDMHTHLGTNLFAVGFFKGDTLQLEGSTEEEGQPSGMGGGGPCHMGG